MPECSFGEHPHSSRFWTDTFRKRPPLWSRSPEVSERAATSGNSAPSIPNCKIFRWTTPSWSRPLASLALLLSLSFQPKSAGERHRFLGRRVRTPFETPRRQYLPRDSYTLDATGNLFWSSSKFIAAVGVNNLVVVETPDALLIWSTRARPGRRQSSEMGSRKSSQKPAVTEPFRPVWGKSPFAYTQDSCIRFASEQTAGAASSPKISPSPMLGSSRTPSPATSCAAKMHARACWSAMTIALRQTYRRPLSLRPSVPPGTPVWLSDKPCPTPALSLLVRQRNAAGGIVITREPQSLFLERYQVQSQLRQQCFAVHRRAN